MGGAEDTETFHLEFGTSELRSQDQGAQFSQVCRKTQMPCHWLPQKHSIGIVWNHQFLISSTTYQG